MNGLSGVVDAILEAGQQRKLLLDRMRAALESGANSQALELARQLCGLDEKSHRANQSIN